MQKDKINKLVFYLYNYNNIDRLIKEREYDIIDMTSVSYYTWIKSIKDEQNTPENQAIKLAEDKQIKEYKQWQEFIKQTLVFLYQNKPIYYKLLYLKYFKKYSNKHIVKILNINEKALKSLNAKLIDLIYKNAEKRELF